jgi:hypothetical protein
MGDSASIAAVVLLVLLGPWVPVCRVIFRRKRERAEDQEQLRELISRTSTLEETVRALQAQRYRPSSPSGEGAVFPGPQLCWLSIEIYPGAPIESEHCPVPA